VTARPQRNVVLDLLADGRWHTSREFVELGVLRAPARVLELRRRGFAIECRRVDHQGGAVYAYRLETSGPAVAAHDDAERPATRRALVDDPEPAPPAESDVELPSIEERRRIAAAAWADSPWGAGDA
jgi:Helix-turn-helix domain